MAVLRRLQVGPIRGIRLQPTAKRTHVPYAPMQEDSQEPLSSPSPARAKGNVLGPTSMGEILVAVAAVVGLGLLYFTSATSPPMRSNFTPVTQLLMQPN
jgi:hypothetical protein